MSEENFRLNNQQKPALKAFTGDLANKVKRWRWNLGNTVEDAIFNNAVKITPTVVMEALYAWLDYEDKVLLKHGVEQRDNVVLTRLKDNLYEHAAEHLQENRKVLLPNGDVVDIDRVEIVTEEEDDGS